MGFLNSHSLSPDFVRELHELARSQRRFHVGLGTGDAIDLPPSQYREVCRSVIAPLWKRAKEGRVFQQPENELAKTVEGLFTRRGKRIDLNPVIDVVTGFEPYWGADQWRRGSIVITTPFDDALLEQVFSSARDPGFLTNLRMIAGSGALRQALKSTETDPQTLTFLLSANRGLNELHVIAHPERIAHALELAISRCRRTDRFLRMYGVCEKS